MRLSLDDAIEAVGRALREQAAEVGRLDARAGDGDLGITATAIAAVLEQPTGASTPSELLRAWGAGIAEAAPSTFGTLLATGLLRAATAVGADPDGPPQRRWAEGLAAAGEAIAERGGAQPGQKTLLDALVPAAAALAAAADGATLPDLWQAAARAAEEGARATAGMRAVHGRAGWLADRSQGHEDAGARLVSVILRAVAEAATARDGGLERQADRTVTKED